MDDDAVRFLKIFTFLSLEEIEEIGKEFDQARHQRLAQKGSGSRSCYFGSR